MNEDRKCRPRGDNPIEEDDIEIIEVVGLEEAEEGIEDFEEEDDDDVVLSFEGDDLGDEGDEEKILLEESVRAEPPVARESYRRLQADFENFKKRVERDREDFDDRATAELVERILPVLDNFERALSSSESNGVANDFAEGVVLIHKQLMDELCKQGLDAVTALGEVFDPLRHEAVATENVLPEMADKIVEEYQRGYFFRRRLLRPALVRVGVAERSTTGEED